MTGDDRDGGATLVEHRKFKNKFAATLQQSKGERGEWGNGGSTAKLSQRKLQFNSFEFVSLSLSPFPCLPAALSLSHSVLALVKCERAFKRYVTYAPRCPLHFNLAQLAASRTFVCLSLSLPFCLSVCAPSSLAVWGNFCRDVVSCLPSAVFTLWALHKKQQTHTPQVCSVPHPSIA